MTNISNTGKGANADMLEGYFDGMDFDNPEPSSNRSRSYHHGFANGRDDRRGKPRAGYETLVAQADEAMSLDAASKLQTSTD